MAESSTIRTGCLLLLLLGGCRSAAPIHVWSPPQIASAVGKRVAVAPIKGDPKLAGPLHQAMLAAGPRDVGRSVFAVDAARLEQPSEVRLASALEGQVSDLTLVHLARANGFDYVLQGEILPSRARHGHRPVRLSDEEPLRLGLVDPHLADGPRVPEDDDLLLRVSWSLLDTQGTASPVGFPVVTRSAADAPLQRRIEDAAAAAWELMVPHVVADQAELASARFLPGAAELRKGNRAAAQGDWMTAERIWQRVLDSHPRCHEAAHNLAIAAVARQDFDAGERLIAQALKRSPAPLYKTTAVWIEQRRRAYHLAFSLDDPPEGWAATRLP